MIFLLYVGREVAARTNEERETAICVGYVSAYVCAL